jgi:hypothetical protein
MSTEREPLTERECLSLLAGARVGRLVYTARALPAVLPTRFRLGSGGDVLVHPRAVDGLARSLDGSVVAFEADLVRPDGGGWTVTVVGPANAEGTPGSPGGEEALLRIGPGLISGWRLPAMAPPAT